MERLTLDNAQLPQDVLLDLRMAGSVLSRYGANQIILYGSMARGTYRPNSDIDICVQGLPAQNFFRALAECLMAAQRSLSIVDFGTLHGYFRERVLAEGRILMSLDILKQEVEFGLENLSKIYDNVRTFSKLDIDSKVKISALTYECLGYYNAIEHLIIRFLKYLNVDLPSGQFSHRDTLKRFDSLVSNTGQQETKNTIATIANLMAFRHVATKIYGFLIDEAKLNVVVSDIELNHQVIENLFRDLIANISKDNNLNG
ncbi:nucleotidyltransferase domain-containing protein [Leptolyngbya cf. ectocarpi LEGE 11479]|uniref:Nucleotidyltransferase domain-containing protein n=1 Tax=Leptolyngbya cf. ectocarpi LEGE 11479 TaxID=1828722 RepID=A0A928ZVD9_LEPEC|nr:nucleotidyltransferase domain-containing protein [Leptolyngbya ectocarpi]MBE9068146.1 nucleotidyltransferase domain-containing protein [Leptolyngbya cf. ectocarpi LEGE 11479]